MQRSALADSVAGHLRNLIVDGELAAGERINEVHLAARLGVSRTPLREALARLSQEGALDRVAHFGWYVRPLTLEEFSQVYPIRPLLDPEALRLAGLPSPEKLRRLRAMDEKIATARTADRIIDLDDAFHRELLSDCPNGVLLELIENFMRRTRRYELALMRERRNVAAARDAHRTVLAALGRRDLARACAALRDNLTSGYEPIAAWLAAREATEAKGQTA